MSTCMTPKHRLVLELYPGDLDARVAGLLADGNSWREIAKAISGDLPSVLTVSHESLRQWYSTEAAA